MEIHKRKGTQHEQNTIEKSSPCGNYGIISKTGYFSGTDGIYTPDGCRCHTKEISQWI